MALMTTSTVAPSPVLLLRHAELPHPERAVRRGEVVKVRRGVYAPAREWNALAPWVRYRARVHAVKLLHPDAVFVLESAASLHPVLPVFRDPLIVHVLEGPGGASRSLAGVRTHTSHGERELVDLGGSVVSSLAETAVDIARHRHAAIGLAVADAALRADRTITPELLVARNEARLSSRGRSLARWSLQRADGRAESPLESVSRATIEWLGFPQPELQTTFLTGGSEDRGDFWWPAFRVLGESDGDIKYDGSHGGALIALKARRARDARLRPRSTSIAHWGWAEVMAFTQLRGILTGAGLPILTPEDTAALVAMRRLLSSQS